MAQSDTAAVDAPTSYDLDSAAAALSNIMDDSGDLLPEDEEPKPDTESEDDPDGDESELEVEDEDGADEDSDEPETAIDAPASLTAEEKAKFAALPKEAQQYVADLESRRAVQVQSATTKAAEAQRTAEATAARADAQAKAVYSQQLRQFADALAPQRPDPMLAQTDPATYIALNAQYDAAKAQHDDFVQQVTALGQEAEGQLTEAEIAERDRRLMAIPEVQNEATRNAFFEKSINAAKELGLDLAGLDRATPVEWQALRKYAEATEKAAKYDAAMAKQMKRVRDGRKAPTMRSNAAPTSGRERGFREATQRLEKTGSLDDAAAAMARLG